jgi:hypothetical protein
MLNMMLDMHLKGLGLVIQYVGKERTQMITCEYDKYVLFPFLSHAYLRFWTQLLAMILLLPLLWTI